MGAQASLWGRTPQAEWAQVGLCAHLKYAGLEFVSVFLLFVCVVCTMQDLCAHAAHTYPGTVTLSSFSASAVSGSRDGASSDSKCFCVCAGARDSFINLT